METTLAELIQREIDGDASETESAALRQRLARDPQSRALHADLARVARIIEDTEEIDPPDRLRETILTRVRDGDRPARHRFGLFPSVRYVAALAAGVLIGLIVGPLVRNGEPGLDPADLSGTMAPLASSDRLLVEGAGITGTVTRTESDDRITLAFDLRVAESVRIVVAFDPEHVAFAGLIPVAGAPMALDLGDGELVLAGDGDHRYELLLAPLNNDPSPLTVRALRSGAIVAEVAFDTSRAP